MKKIVKIANIIFLIILLPVLLINSVILFNSYMHPDEIPSFYGWKPFIVLSGSMETEIYSGDLVIVKEVDVNSIKEGDIIAFKEDNIVITHRVVEKIKNNGEIKYITKGDNNNTEDIGYVLQEQIEGLYKFKITGLGNLAMFIQTPLGMITCLSIPLGLLLLLQMYDSKKSKEYEKGKQNELKKEIEKLKQQNEELSKNRKC